MQHRHVSPIRYHPFGHSLTRHVRIRPLICYAGVLASRGHDTRQRPIAGLTAFSLASIVRGGNNGDGILF
jgi:hypothetical protein